MKKLLLLWFLCLSATTGVASPPPSFKHLPDYMVNNHCEPFSWSALRMLQRRGIPAHRITYGWSQFGGARAFHAAILFQWEGRIYFMDNARMGPRRVAGKTDLGCVHHIHSDWQTHSWMVNEQNQRVAPRKIADLFAPAPEWMQHLKREGVAR